MYKFSHCFSPFQVTFWDGGKKKPRPFVSIVVSSFVDFFNSYTIKIQIPQYILHKIAQFQYGTVPITYNISFNSAIVDTV